MSKYIILFILLFFGSRITAQSGLHSSGGNASGSTGSIAYSVGQLFTVPSSNGNISVSPGVQQPYEINEIVGAKDVLPPFVVEIFPNPATDVLNITIPGKEMESMLIFNLSGVDGKIYISKESNMSNLELDTSGLPSGTYILSISNNKKQNRLYKIIKK